MSKLDRLIQVFRQCRGPFPYKELVRLLVGLGYTERATGGGSRRRFMNSVTGHIIRLHEPHPGTEVKFYVVKDVRNSLIEQGLI